MESNNRIGEVIIREVIKYLNAKDYYDLCLVDRNINKACQKLINYELKYKYLFKNMIPKVNNEPQIWQKYFNIRFKICILSKQLLSMSYDLEMGKYSRWFTSSTPQDLVYLIFLVGVFGLNSSDQNKLNKIQIEILCELTERNFSDSALLISKKYSLNFEDYVGYFLNANKNDIFGIIWHIGNFTIRGCHRIKNKNEASISDLHDRQQDCLIELVNAVTKMKDGNLKIRVEGLLIG